MSVETPIIGEMVPMRPGAAPRGWAFAQGQLLPVAGMPQLFNLIGYTFGGHDTVFALPHLPHLQTGLVYAIALDGLEPLQGPPPNPVLSEMSIFKKGETPRGWTQANGQMLQIAQDQALFSVLGHTFGGAGPAPTFGLPNLPPLGDGALEYNISLEGTYPIEP